MRFLIVLFVLVCNFSAIANGDPSAEFFAKMSKLCGAKYSGEMTFPKDGLDSFAGKTLIASFLSCDQSEIQIAFAVGEDQSRTWFLRTIDQGLEFKHRHLLVDGSLDPITNYGGSNSDQGTAYTQSFPADEFTQQLIPEASTNVWNLEISKDLNTLTYHLERHNKPRFTAVLYRDE